MNALSINIDLYLVAVQVTLSLEQFKKLEQQVASVADLKRAMDELVQTNSKLMNLLVKESQGTQA